MADAIIRQRLVTDERLIRRVVRRLGQAGAPGGAEHVAAMWGEAEQLRLNLMRQEGALSAAAREEAYYLDEQQRLGMSGATAPLCPSVPAIVRWISPASIIACDRTQSHAIAHDRTRSHTIAHDRTQSQKPSDTLLEGEIAQLGASIAGLRRRLEAERAERADRDEYDRIAALIGKLQSVPDLEAALRGVHEQGGRIAERQEHIQRCVEAGAIEAYSHIDAIKSLCATVEASLRSLE